MKRTVTLANGRTVPAIGQGTWFLGDDPSVRSTEIEALQKGIEAGMTLIDTAEMYGSGRSERLVGDAIKGFDRDSLFLVSKVLPQNAGKSRMRRALEGTLSRMGTDHLDLYLYHWRGSYPLSETVACFEELKREGLIRGWGVSNFDVDDMEELWHTPGGTACLVDQVLYHTGSRGIEYALIPWMKKHRVTLMSYCPLAQAGSLRRGLFHDGVLKDIAAKYGVTVPEILLAWNVRSGNTIAIPRSGKAAHTLSNAHAGTIELTEEDLALIDSRFPAPIRKEPLDIE